MANDAAPMTQFLEESVVVSLLVNLRKAREEVAIAKVKLDELRVTAELAAMKQYIALA